jgi:N-acyl-L-homoserine lactone synthetase
MSTGKYSARIIDRRWFEEIGKLRYHFFCSKKGWVENSAESNVELDSYDDHAVHFGVFSGNELVGYMRALLASAPCGMMIDHDFRQCLTDEEFKLIRRENSLELSRRVTSLNLTSKEQLAVVQHLFYEFYYYCRLHGIEHVYTVQFRAINRESYTFANGSCVNVDYSSTSEHETHFTSTGMIADYISYVNEKLER